MNYTTRTKKLITLPSGASVVIRKLVAGDFAGASRDVPVIDPERRKSNAAPTPQDLEFGMRISTVILTKCCSALSYQGETLRIVDKPFNDPGLKADELPIELLEQSDAEAIIVAVQEFSGLRGGAPNGATFQPEPNGNVLSAGEAVREVASRSQRPCH